MIRSKSTRRRSGFTLVELMIAAAITILIMTILSVCFQTSMQAMSSMRAQGDAADQLRAVGEVMKRDFKADHFLSGEGAFQVNNNGRRLSDYDFQINPGFLIGATANNGFVRLDSPTSTFEGNDGSFDSFRNTGCTIWFTCVLPGGTDGNLYTATSSGQVFSSEAAEVSYFLAPTGLLTPGGLPISNLIRRQRLIATDANKQLLLPTNDPEVFSTYSFTFPGPPAPQNFTRVNTMTTLATGEVLQTVGGPAFTGPTRGLSIGSMLAPLSSPGRVGDDIMLSNVISFDVKPTWQTTNPSRLPVPFPGRVGPPFFVPNSDAPYDNLTIASGGATSFFDSIGPNLPIRVHGVQIRIRVYDPKVKTARQSTYMFDL